MSDFLVCWSCHGRGWVFNGQLDDGMTTGRDRCHHCEGTGRVSVATLEREITRMRAIAYGLLP